MNYFSSLLQRILPAFGSGKSSTPPSITSYRQPRKGASLSGAPVSGVAHPALISPPERESRITAHVAGDDYVRALLEAQRASARLGEWNRYRTLRMRMAQHHYARGAYLESLELLMDVWYLDMNGPRDVNRLNGAQLGTEAPGFDPRIGQVSATVQRKVRRVATMLNLSFDELQVIFFAVAGPTYRAYHLPLPPREAWFQIGSAVR